MLSNFLVEYVLDLRKSVSHLDERRYIDVLDAVDIIKHMKEGERRLLYTAFSPDTEFRVYLQKVTAEPHFRVYFDQYEE